MKDNDFYVLGGVILAFLLSTGVAAAILALVAYIVTILWRVVMVEGFGLPALSFWQAFAAMVLARLLLGGARRD